MSRGLRSGAGDNAAEAKPTTSVPVEHITGAILVLRGHRVLLDTELAALYGVSTKRFNEQARRNRERFPADFMFQLNVQEIESLRSQNATLKDAFVNTHWNSLSETGISPLPFLVPSQLGYVDFSARKLREARMDEHDVRWFRFSLVSWYAFAAPHLEFGYDVRTHELREYLGPSNIHGDGNRSLSVRIEFPSAERRTDVVMADVERAAAGPLTGRCVFP